MIPPSGDPGEPTNEDYRRIVLFVAAPAIGFFVPSLVLAGVPQALWLPFTLLSVLAATWITASFLYVPRSAGLVACLAAGSNALVVAGLGALFRDYYHEIALLYVLLVAGHAVVHGLTPALVTVALGPVLVPYFIEDPRSANWSDPFYTALYLTGTALVPWVGWRLAQRRAAVLWSLRRSSEAERSRLAAILASLGDAVVVVDGEQNVVMTNDAYERRFGASGLVGPEDEHGRRLPRSRWPQVRVSRGEPFRMTFTMRTRSGDRHWFEATGAPITGVDGTAGGVVVIRDITDRSLRRLQEEFMATASHELRTPVAALHGYLQLLERHIDPATSEASADYARSALSQTRRIGHLLDRLFDLARLQTGGLEVELRPVEVTALVGRAVGSARTIGVDHDLELEADVPPDLRVRADPGRLEEVLLNLLTNAITHAPESKRIEIRINRERDHVAIRIRDHGPGIPAAQLARLFSGARGARRDGRGRGGLGLGLHISRELMRAQGGTIEIASSEGIGTTATVRLRVASAADADHDGRGGRPADSEIVGRRPSR